MGIFTRFKDIIGSNINAMLDHAEDPEKLIRLMVREMEETLVELKASCAGSMAARKRLERELDEVRAGAAKWAERAELAIDKGREDLAREALLEKQRFDRRAEVVEGELAASDELVLQAQDDIAQLEAKMNAAKEKQRLLIQRHARAGERKRARTDMRRADSMDAVIRFEQMEQRIERMEAEAELAGPVSGAEPSLEEKFAQLEGDSGVEAELAALKAAKVAKSGSAKSDPAKSGKGGE